MAEDSVYTLDNPPRFQRGPEYLRIVFADGAVSINLKTGQVDLGGLSVDDAAREFWNAVERLAPNAELFTKPR